MPTVAIHRLSPRDLPAILALRRRALDRAPETFGASFAPVDAYLRAFEDKLATAFDREDDFALGAFDDGALGGMIGCKRLPGLKARHRAYVWGMYVDEALRGRGVGRRLVEEMLIKARAIDGLEVLELTVIADNARARGLYERFGFVAWGVQRDAVLWEGRRGDEAHLALDLRA
ncbi:MAG: GNAT family N-acetyltransferase [Polyangiales bacterium]